MCASRRLWSAAGEIQKTFCTLLGEEDIESATNIKVTSKFGNKIEEKWINNDNKLFERTIFVEALKRAWFTTTSRKLLEGTFKYPHWRGVTLANPRIKIIERALLNAFEHQFEGFHVWDKIDEKGGTKRLIIVGKKLIKITKSGV
jgi:hypothetical protein